MRSAFAESAMLGRKIENRAVSFGFPARSASDSLDGKKAEQRSAK